MTTRRLLLAIPALVAARCAPPPPPPPTLELTINAGPDQNPDPVGHPASVAVHIYQLASSARFQRADPFALIEREGPTLGTDDLASEEIVVRPGEAQTVKHELKPATQFLGIAVLFRDIDAAQWRVLSPTAPNGPSRFTLTIAGKTAALMKS